ncbi:uncharacterized protein LOC134831574 isoform X2 [Culicoides brevitarsis]|uniref:uncharacterized protein LOC134831574 isoform X2 n=1 Tax=Culicoides brevitarsis TaxID=469753 RepID=UPI00307B862C
METRSKASRQHRSLIEKLPVEMLVEIFEYLDSWSIRRCSEVCLTFFHLTLRPEFRKFFKLTISEDYLASNCGIGMTFAPGNRSKRTFDHLTLERVSFKTLPFAKNFFMRLGSEITVLELKEDFFYPRMVEKGSETQDRNFRENILKNFPNLKKLNLDCEENIPILKYFPASLKEIFVNGHTFFEDLKEFKDSLHENGAVNVKSLIFSKLHLDEDSEFSQGLKVSDAVMNIHNDLSHSENFLGFENNWNILEEKSLDLNDITGIVCDAFLSISFEPLLRLQNLKSIELTVFHSRECFINHQQAFPDFSHVKSLKLHFYKTSDCDTCTRNILSSFTGLTKLDLNVNLMDDKIRLIFANMPDLEHLELHGRIPRHIFDSSQYAQYSIEQLKKLQHLLIYDKISHESSGLTNKCLLRFSYLPNLKTLCLNCRYNFKTDGIRNLIQQCPNVSNFCSTNNTISDKMVQEMLQGWHQLTTLLLPNKVFEKETWEIAKTKSRFLSYVAVSDDRDLSFSEKMSLFESMSCLIAIKIGAEVFTRAEYCNQDVYLDEYPQIKMQLKRKHQGTKSKSNKRPCTHELYCLPLVAKFEDMDDD